MLLERMSEFSAFADHRYLALTTFRKDGQPETASFWFVLDGNKLNVMLRANAAEIQRIRHNAQVEVAPCDEHGVLVGTAIEAMALIVPDDENYPAAHAFAQKYGIRKHSTEIFWRLRGSRCLYLEITPM